MRVLFEIVGPFIAGWIGYAVGSWSGFFVGVVIYAFLRCGLFEALVNAFD